MAWLFGLGKDSGANVPPIDDPPADSKHDPIPLTKSEKKAMEAYRFDSSALERAAQAARELERSRKSSLSLLYKEFTKKIE